LNAFKEIAKKCDEIGQGIDVANRDSTEVEKLIGFFVNQVVLRTDLGGNLRFATDLFEPRPWQEFETVLRPAATDRSYRSPR